MVDHNLIADIGFDEGAIDVCVGDFDLNEMMSGEVQENLRRGRILQGRIVGKAGDDAVIDVGLKSEGLVNKNEFDYYRAAYEQDSELTELKALSAALEIKGLAEAMNGWEDHHGIGLNMVAGVLVEQTDWESEDVDDFVERLTEGYFAFGGGLFDEDED